MQRYKWELSIQKAQISLQIEILNRLLNSCNACVCVKTFPKRYEFNWYDKKQLDFLDKRENQWKIS
jgi:hypothetical protein